MKTCLIVLLALATFSAALAQEVEMRPKKVDGQAIDSRPSPLAIASIKKGDSYVKVIYSQPHLRGRELFGKKIPYGEVWRLGANEATEITLTRDVRIGGKTLKAGTYALYCLPEENQWTLIFNNELGNWGAYGYEEAKDALRITQKIEKASEHFEPLTIWFSEKAMHMAWGDQQINIPIAL